jgi:fibronectin type 3 domain-containing protein
MAHSAQLSWTASTDTVSGYNIYKGTAAGNEGATPINGSTLVTGTTFTDTNVTAGEKLSYVVTSVAADGVESVHSNEILVVIPIAPPSNLTVVVL